MNALAFRRVKKLDKGDTVHWTDPDDATCSGAHTIIEIQTESGAIEDWDSVLVLRNNAGGVVEAYVSEII